MTCPRIIVISGPTATGKTAIGVAVAKALGGEVISCDSQVVYRELTIGTAKPTPDEMQGVPHHMIDVVSPDAQYSAGQYATQARPILDRLLASNTPVVIVGGTGFYLRSLLQPAHLPLVKPNPELRQSLEALLASQGAQVLYDMLVSQDPRRAAQLEANDSKRVIRALEIIAETGEPVPETPIEYADPIQSAILTFSDRARHATTIHQRLVDMVTAGFIEEAVSIFERYGDCPALQTAHGYRQMLSVSKGEQSLTEAIEEVAILIRQYSKRQLTWFRQIPNLTSFDISTTSLDAITETIIATYNKAHEHSLA